jgi:hypothetical protein
MLEAGELQGFAERYPQFRARFSAELRALIDVMNWITINTDEEVRRKRRGT